jgi:hypothetical protein
MAVGVDSAGEGTRVLPGMTGLHGDLSSLPSGNNTGGRLFGARGSDAARQLDGVRVGGQRLLRLVERRSSVWTGIFDRGAEVLGGIDGRV